MVVFTPAGRSDERSVLFRRRVYSTWAMFYGLDQYIWHPAGHPTRGIGVFFAFGTADGKTNPIKYSYDMGIGGNGVVPGRPATPLASAGPAPS